MKEIILNGQKGIGGEAQGKALVSKSVISWYATFDVDGNVVDRENELYGRNIAGSVLVFPSFKGSTVGSVRLYEMAVRGSAPKALVIAAADPVTLSGAILGDIPVVHRFDVDPISVIRNGDTVSVVGKTGAVTVKRD
jgi:predicted aconitase with swiveling domain